MRRNVGVGAIMKQKLEKEKYKEKSSEIQENELEKLVQQMEVFRANLEEFATKHKEEIKKNPDFRKHFQEMCAVIGVDPLSSSKGFWSVLGMGDFYYELGVQIVEVCLATNYKNGGLITLEELRDKLVNARGKSKKHQEITYEDLLAAVKKLKVFGNGFSVIDTGKVKKKWIIQSIPCELNIDHTEILKKSCESGSMYVTKKVLIEDFLWEEKRAQSALDTLIREGIVWIDDQDPCGKSLYWFPSFFSEKSSMS